MITIKYDKKKIFNLDQLDRKPLIKALRKGANVIAKASRKALNKNTVSKPGEIPGRDTGALRKAVKVEVARRPPGLWSAVLYKKPVEDKMFYPAPLFYGRRKGDLVKRVNPFEVEAERADDEVQSIISKALDEEAI